MKYLVTGAAGFIGARVCERLCEAGFEVVGIDNLNDYYDVSLKQARLQKLADFNHFQFQKLDLADREAMAELFAKGGFKRVIHLGAKPASVIRLKIPMLMQTVILSALLLCWKGVVIMA